MTVLKLAPCLLLLWALGTVPYGKKWRGITPLHSSRADVEAILGTSSDTKHDWTTYQTEEAAISIRYARGLPCQSTSNSKWRVSEGIVLSITVAPKTIIRFSDLNIDTRRYERVPDPHSLNKAEYIDKEEGEAIAVANEEVSSFRYFGGSRDSALRCPNSL